MKKIYLLWASILLCGSLHAQSSNLELGVSLVGPTGINAKVWIDRGQAIDLAFSLDAGSDFGFLYLHADYLKHLYGKFQVDGGEMPFYFGVGGKGLFGTNTSAGIRLPIGVTYLYGKPIFDVFFELAPSLDVYPNARFYFQGAMGFRFFL